MMFKTPELLGAPPWGKKQTFFGGDRSPMAFKGGGGAIFQIFEGQTKISAHYHH